MTTRRLLTAVPRTVSKLWLPHPQVKTLILHPSQVLFKKGKKCWRQIRIPWRFDIAYTVLLHVSVDKAELAL